MRNAKAYIGALFFAALISLPLLFIMGLHIVQWRAQNAAKHNLQKAFLQTVVLKVQDVHWEKKGKELRIGNQLFDVKHIIYKNGTAIVTGLYDEAEMAVEKKVKETTTEGSSLFIALLLIMQFFVPLHLCFLMVFKWHTLRHLKRLILPFYLSPVLQVPYPPPLF